MFQAFRRQVWRNWLELTRPERAVLGVCWLAALLLFLVPDRRAAWILGAAGVAWAAAITGWALWNRGFRILGPHFYYDVVRLARRGRSTVLRCLYIAAMFAGLTVVYFETPTHQHHVNEFARVSEHFSYALFIVQNAAILVLTPAYLGSAIAEEKERHTLDLLFTTHLSNTEIILGKLTSRCIHLVGFVLAGLPVLSLVQFWGGVDLLLISGNLANTLLNIISLGSVCLLASVLARTVAGAVITCYAILLPTGFCCLSMMHGFPFVLQDARSGATGVVTVQDLGILCIIHVVVTAGCLALAIAALRDREPSASWGPPPPPVRRRGEEAPAPAPVDKNPEPAENRARPRHVEEPADMFNVLYALPPVSDHPLLWKERFLGGPSWLFSPIVFVPVLPFLATGFLLMAFWVVNALFRNGRNYEHALEAWTALFKFLYYLFLGCYLLGVAWRSGASIARERQQQTLEPLLLLPIERREILTAKLLGCLMRGWPWLALSFAATAFGTLIGVYHPFSAVLLALAPWPMILFTATLGLLLSIGMQTVLRANLVMVLAPLGLLWCTSFSFETIAFPIQPRGLEWERGVAACGQELAYLAAAYGCWRMALALFEKRG